MSDSVILNSIFKIIKFLIKACKGSMFFQAFSRLDEILKKAALNSGFVKVFLGRDDNVILKNSMSYRVFTKVLNAVVKAARTIGVWIAGSAIVKLFSDVITVSKVNAFRLVGVFGSAFLISNISYSAITRADSLAKLVLKLMLLAGLIIVSKIKIDFMEALNTSKAVRIFKWIISYEN